MVSVVSLESPHQSDSNEYTKYTIFNIKKKIKLNDPRSAAMGFFSNGLQNESETAVVNEPSVFEPQKFYCILFYCLQLKQHAFCSPSRNIKLTCAGQFLRGVLKLLIHVLVCAMLFMIMIMALN